LNTLFGATDCPELALLYPLEGESVEDAARRTFGRVPGANTTLIVIHGPPPRRASDAPPVTPAPVAASVAPTVEQLKELARDQGARNDLTSPNGETKSEYASALERTGISAGVGHPVVLMTTLSCNLAGPEWTGRQWRDSYRRPVQYLADNGLLPIGE